MSSSEAEIYLRDALLYPMKTIPIYMESADALKFS